MFHRWILPLVGFGLVLFAGEFTMAMASDEQKKKKKFKRCQTAKGTLI